MFRVHQPISVVTQFDPSPLIMNRFKTLTTSQHVYMQSEYMHVLLPASL